MKRTVTRKTQGDSVPTLCVSRNDDFYSPSHGLPDRHHSNSLEGHYTGRAGSSSTTAASGGAARTKSGLLSATRERLSGSLRQTTPAKAGRDIRPAPHFYRSDAAFTSSAAAAEMVVEMKRRPVRPIITGGPTSSAARAKMVLRSVPVGSLQDGQRLSTRSSPHLSATFSRDSPFSPSETCYEYSSREPSSTGATAPRSTLLRPASRSSPSQGLAATYHSGTASGDWHGSLSGTLRNDRDLNGTTKSTSSSRKGGNGDKPRKKSRKTGGSAPRTRPGTAAPSSSTTRRSDRLSPACSTATPSTTPRTTRGGAGGECPLSPDPPSRGGRGAKGGDSSGQKARPLPTLDLHQLLDPDEMGAPSFPFARQNTTTPRVVAEGHHHEDSIYEIRSPSPPGSTTSFSTEMRAMRHFRFPMAFAAESVRSRRTISSGCGSHSEVHDCRNYVPCVDTASSSAISTPQWRDRSLSSQVPYVPMTAIRGGSSRGRVSATPSGASPSGASPLPSVRQADLHDIRPHGAVNSPGGAATPAAIASGGVASSPPPAGSAHHYHHPYRGDGSGEAPAAAAAAGDDVGSVGRSAKIPRRLIDCEGY